MRNMNQLELYVPKIEELWFRQKMLSDPDTMSYNANWDLGFDGYHNDTGCIDFPESEWSEWYSYWIGNETKCFYAYIRRKSDGAFIGDVNFHYTPDRDWWDMGIVIFAPYRGCGYAAPALKLMLGHAFQNCGVTRIHNDFEVSRTAALKAHLSAGFHEIGVEDGIVRLMITADEFIA